MLLRGDGGGRNILHARKFSRSVLVLRSSRGSASFIRKLCSGCLWDFVATFCIQISDDPCFHMIIIVVKIGGRYNLDCEVTSPCMYERVAVSFDLTALITLS